MKSVSSPLLCAAAALFWALLGSSCVSEKDVLYLQDVEPSITELKSENYQTTIQKDDMLSVTVSSKQPELTAPFSFSEIGQKDGSTSSSQKGYLVDANGDIELPIIGKIRAAGKSCTQLADDIAASLRSNDYIRDATVNVRITNFKFYVLGEAGTGVHTIEGQRLTILEAVSMAGDLNIGGDRVVTLIREKDGKRKIAKIDLRSKELFDSPYYYIQQNDIIYVTPSDRLLNTPQTNVMQWWGWGLSGLGLIGAIIALSV